MGFVKVIKTLKEQEYPGTILADPSLRTPSLIALFSNKESEVIYVPIMPTERIYKEYPQVAKALEDNGLELYNFPINVWDALDIINHFVSNNFSARRRVNLKGRRRRTRRKRGPRRQQ